MAADARLISGKAASLEAAFGESLSKLFETVKNVSNKAGVFQNNLVGIQTTLDKVEKMGPMINELDRTKEETEKLIKQMKKGEKLVSKCLKINRWNIYARAQHSRKLTQLEEALARYFMIDIKAQVLKLGLETLVLRLDNAIPQQLNLTHAWSSCAVPPPPNFIVGLDVPLKQLKVELFKEEVFSLVLSAPGGCGKTTLVKMLAHDQEIRGKFGENIMFVHFSKTPNFEVLARRLFQHEYFQAREFPSDEHDAIDEIGKLLNQTKVPILLILDDVWPGSEDAFGKLKSHTPNYKILVTSRSKLPTFGLPYKLSQLNDEDATTLFLHYATLQDSSSYIAPVGDDIVKKMVKFCGGVPLALTTIGRSLCGEDAAVWQRKVLEWSSGDHSILDSNRELLERLKKSLDFPDDQVIMKECFMDLGSFPENQRIHVATLIDMWEELYQLNSTKAIDTLHEISARNLASLQGTWKYGNEFEGRSEDFVLQHDLLRELAIHQSSQEPIEQRKRLIFDISGSNLPKWWTEQSQLPISARLLSISTDEKFSSSNWCNILPAQVEVLVLNFQANNYTFPMCLERMDKLKVLILTQNGISPAELCDFQLLGSLPNLKIIRLENISIPSLCKTLVVLKSLKKISLLRCDIGQAFRNCTSQVSDALPNLTDINIECCNDLVELPAGLCAIVHLKKLNITNCQKLSTLPEGIGELRNLEVLRLRSCTELSELPQSIRSLHNLSILGISDCLSIIKVPEHIGELLNLKELHMDGCLSLGDIPLPESIMNLKQLELVVCDEVIKAKFWEPIKDVLTNVEVVVPTNDHINSSVPSPS